MNVFFFFECVKARQINLKSLKIGLKKKKKIVESDESPKVKYIIKIEFKKMKENWEGKKIVRKNC